jgi:hypothetical protein
LLRVATRERKRELGALLAVGFTTSRKRRESELIMGFCFEKNIEKKRRAYIFLFFATVRPARRRSEKKEVFSVSYCYVYIYIYIYIYISCRFTAREKQRG